MVSRSIVMALGLLIMLAGAAGWLVFRVRKVRHAYLKQRYKTLRDGFICVKCGYNLRKSPNICPECGWVVGVDPT